MRTVGHSASKAGTRNFGLPNSDPDDVILLTRLLPVRHVLREPTEFSQNPRL